MHDDGTFDEAVAAAYDEGDESLPAAVQPVVDLLARLAGSGPVLEFAVGTGRIALPLAQRGIRVHGIDLSRPMLERLRAKAGGGALPVTLGDIAETRVEGSFALVFLVFNTIMNLTTQAAQVACFRNAAAHLEPGGRFLVEVLVPRLQKLPFGERYQAFDVGKEHWGIDEIDVATQSLTSHHLRLRRGELRRSSIPFRYVWPSELDLMAQLAGLALESRWGGWRGEPFTNTSERHVSIWVKPTA